MSVNFLILRWKKKL